LGAAEGRRMARQARAPRRGRGAGGGI